jgi:vacuolar-type H+-ATPase subunit I/STV1
MAKVEIIGPKNEFFEVVSLLHDQGKIHIEDLSRKISSGEVPLQRMEVFEQQQQDQERMEELLIRVRAIVKALHRDDIHLDAAARRSMYDDLFAKDTSELAAEVAGVIEEVEDRTSGLASSRTNLESELTLLARYEPILQKIQPLAKQIVTTGAYESVALLFERRYKSALELSRRSSTRSRTSSTRSSRPTSTRTPRRRSSSSARRTPIRSTSSWPWRTSTRSDCLPSSRTCRSTLATRGQGAQRTPARRAREGFASSSRRCRNLVPEADDDP